MFRLSALPLVFLVACSSPDEHAPYKVTCVRNCMPAPGPSFVPVPPAEGGVPGPGGADGGTGTLAAAVWVLGDGSFTTRTPFTGGGRLVVQGPTFAVGADFTSTPVQLSGVEASPLLWVSVDPTAGSQELLRTIQPVDGRAAAVDVDIAPASIMNDVLAGVVRRVPPPSLDPARAQLVITFVNSNNVPQPEIEIVQHDGDAVVYDVGGNTYTDATLGTGPGGIGVVINARPRRAPAGSEFPGGSLVLAYRAVNQANVGSFEVFAAPRSVTLARVILR